MVDTPENSEVLELLKSAEDLQPTEQLQLAEEIKIGPEIVAPSFRDEAPVQLPVEDEGTVDIRQQIASMNLPGRIKLAMFGNGICRGLLIRDSNKLVQSFVLKNPKLQVKEVEEFAKNPHLSEQVLRIIADSRIFMKSPLVKYNLVTNPKTPGDIALKWIRYLQAHELKKIAKSKNLPQLIATAAKKIVTDQERH